MDVNHVKLLFVVGFLCMWSIDDVSSIAGKYPAYSLQNMPRTDFTCRDKILGGYYADAETQCQMFHVCVKVAGVGVQDFRFLCPNGTAFDQEAQTCADWGDVDCEQATLYYGSDNFDLYRIGSGFESKRAPFAEEDEAIFHLQRAESNDARRSKELIVNQNQINRNDKHATFNHKHHQQQQQQHHHQQQQEQQQQQRVIDNVVSIRPSKQYTPQQNKPSEVPQSIASSTPRVNITSTTQAYVTSRPTTTVLSQSKQSNYYNNDEIFKGSHSSNFYSNRNSNADDDDDVRRVANGGSNSNAKKSRQRNHHRGRSQYRGTSSTTKATTTSTYRPPSTYATPTAFSVAATAAASSARPTFASSSTPANAYFTTIKTTTSEPFKFTFTPSVVHSANTGTQDTQFVRQSSNNYNAINGGKSIGPLQQQYQQSNYQTGPQYTTANNKFNGVSSTAQPHIPPSIVSVPTPFNSNHNHNQNNQQSGGNFLGSPSSGRFFDNNNPINNYQTTSPFTNSQSVYNQNQFFGNNRTVTPTTAALQAQNGQFGQFNSNASNFQQQNFLPFFNGQRGSGSTTTTTTKTTSTTKVPTAAPTHAQQTQIARKPFNEEPPSFKQQDFLNFYQNEQQRYTAQAKNQFTSTEKNRRFEQQPFTEAARLEQQRRLHYDINDYLTTSKYNVQNQYSPTSEQYRSVQTFPTHQPTPNHHQYQQSNQNRLQTTSASPSTASSAPKQQYEPYKQYHDLQRQHTRQTSTASSANSKSYDPPPTKKFSTLVPKEYYAPTTFKPFYFNVAKQINDNLSSPPKYFTNSTQSAVTTSTTSRTISIAPSQPRLNALPSQAPTTNFHQTKPTVNVDDGQYHPEAIDEDDGQYHPELYEQDFARNKLKNKRKQKLAQQQQQHQHHRNQFQSNNFNSNYRGTSNNFAGSSNEEFLNTAHSQNIAASGNELRAEQAAKFSAAFGKQSTTRQPSGNGIFGSTQNTAKSQSTSLKPVPKAPTISPNASTKKAPAALGQDDKDKDASYDYAYYDTGFNDAAHEYSEYDIGDFGKTRKSKN